MIESFNGSFRDECLNMKWFMSLEDARDKVTCSPKSSPPKKRENDKLKKRERWMK